MIAALAPSVGSAGHLPQRGRIFVAFQIHPQPPPHQPRVIDRRRQPDPPHLRREQLKPRQMQGQQVAALGRPDGVGLVDDHAGEISEIFPRAFPGAEQAQLLGRGQQDVRRLDPLTGLAALAGVARAALGDDLQPHLADRGHQIALDIHGQGLERRDVEGVDAGRGVARRAFGQFDQAGQEARQGLAATGGGDQQGAATRPRLGQHVQLMGARSPAARGEPVLKAGR